MTLLLLHGSAWQYIVVVKSQVLGEGGTEFEHQLSHCKAV